MIIFQKKIISKKEKPVKQDQILKNIQTSTNKMNEMLNASIMKRDMNPLSNKKIVSAEKEKKNLQMNQMNRKKKTSLLLLFKLIKNTY